jgi:hypothetical protein
MLDPLPLAKYSKAQVKEIVDEHRRRSAAAAAAAAIERGLVVGGDDEAATAGSLGRGVDGTGGGGKGSPNSTLRGGDDGEDEVGLYNLNAVDP